MHRLSGADHRRPQRRDRAPDVLPDVSARHRAREGREIPARAGEEAGSAEKAESVEVMTLSPIGSPPRFTLRRVLRPTFRVEFEYDGDAWDGEKIAARSSRNVMSRTFFSESAAYRWLARRMIFARRDTFGDTRVTKCSLCESQPVEDGPVLREDDYDPGPQCRYHAEHRFRRLESRLARWLRWRDRRGANGATP